MTAVVAPPPRLDSPELLGYPAFLRPRVAAPSVYYAGFWIRVGVNIIDSAALALLYLVVDYVVQALVGVVGGIAHFDADAAKTGVSVGCALAVFVYYSTVLTARHSASPGMRFCSLRIVRDADIAQQPDRRTLYIRGILWVAFSIAAPLKFIDALYVVIDPRKRSIHDLIVGTAVVRKAPSPPALASMLCSVCGRPVDEGTLCRKHGGSFGLTLTLTGHTVSLQFAAILLAAFALAGVIVGAVFLVTGQPVAVVGIILGAVLLRTTMALTQLRSWARWVGFGAGVLIAIGGVAVGISQVLSSNAGGWVLVVLGAVGVLIGACLWTPETYRAFRRIPG